MRIDTNALIRLRYERGWKQQELAARAGISKSYMSELEAGRAQPSAAVVARLAETLGVAATELVVEP